MEASPLPTSDSESWAEEFDQSLNFQRERVRKFLADQRLRIERIEAELVQRVQQVAEELADNRLETQRAAKENQERSERLVRETETLQAVKKEIDARQAEWEELLRRAEQQQKALAEQIRHQQEELQRRHEELDKRLPEINAAEAKLHQDRRVFDLERAEHKAELEQLAIARERLEAKQAEFDRQDAGGPIDEDLRRRYELAMDDVRELKAENAELQQRLARQLSAKPQPLVGEALDWETEKQRIIAALESDFDENDPRDATERPRIEEMVRVTDRAIAQKCQEISQLKQLLENQGENLGAAAVGAAAPGEIPEPESIFQDEREELKRLQDEWREKICQAEIDISVERAKIAREKAEIEARLRTLEERTGRPDSESDNSVTPDKPARGRWLTRLGLKDPEQK